MKLFAECIFRGVKIAIKQRSEFSEIDYNLQNKSFIQDNKFNDFKFAAILMPNNDNENGLSIKIIKNNKFKKYYMYYKT